MEKLNLTKVFSAFLVGVIVILLTTNVFAADNTGFNDLTSTLNNTSNTNSNTTNTNTNSALLTNNTNTVNTIKNTNTNTNTNTTNTSVYNNTNLPKTGIEDSMPVAMLIVIFAISAIYAYKKIRDYRNI